MNVRPSKVAVAVLPPRDWTNILFIGFAHLTALAALAWICAVRLSLPTIGLGAAWFALCSLSISGGYHRLFAHPTYRANGFIRAFYLIFGAASVQNSALKWAADHRVHHTKTDSDDDPYDIRRGLWWAHMGWILRREVRPAALHRVKDLIADPLLRWQDRHYRLIALLFGAAVPAAVGLAWRDPIGALLVAGFLRLVIQWHATGAVNSIAHKYGRQPYSTLTSARDSSWLAFITFGESYHNFHHRFQSDYRNGVRWWHFDPTKWFVWSLSHVGLARDLRRTPAEAIERARASRRSEG